MQFRGILFLVALGLSQFVCAKDVNIEVVSEEAFPLQYSVDGQVFGPTTEMVRLVLEEADLSYDIAMMPWARAYELAKHKPNTLIFSMARTPVREHQFHWIGEVTRFEYYFYTTKEFAAKNKINAQTIKNYRIGSVRNSATYQHLIEKDFERVFPVSAPDQNYEKLLTGRIDMFPASRSVFQLSCANVRSDCHNFVPVLPLELPPVSLFFALSKSTPTSTVNRIINAYNRLIDERSTQVATNRP